MGAVAERHGPADPGELLHGDDVVEVAHAAAPVVGVGRDPQQPHLTQLPPELPLPWSQRSHSNTHNMTLLSHSSGAY